MKPHRSSPGRSEPAPGLRKERATDQQGDFADEIADSPPQPRRISREVMEKLRPADHDPDDPASV